MSTTREVTRLTLTREQSAGVAVEWLKRYGITRVAFIPSTLASAGGLVWQETYRSPVQFAVVGDVLAAVDLGGTSGEPTVINYGPRGREG